MSALADQAKKELNVEWDVIGLTPEERQAELEALASEVRAVYINRVQKEQALKQSMKDDIVRMTSEINAIRVRLENFEVFSAPSGCLRPSFEATKAELAHQTALKDAREAEIKTLLDQLHGLWRRLGAPFKPGFEGLTNDITQSKLAAIQEEIKTASTETARREEAVALLCNEIAEQIEELKLEEEGTEDPDSEEGKAITASGLAGPDIATVLTRTTLDDFDKKILARDVASIGIDTETIARLRKRTDVLAQMRDERDANLRVMANEITRLWVRLAVPVQEQQNWIYLHKGLSIRSLRSCQKELIRLKILKAQSLEKLIGHARKRITELWDELQYSEADRAAFAPFYVETASDALLDQHEEEIKALEAKAEAMRPLLALVAKRAQLKEEEAEYKASLQDPNRFRIPGRLIQEEKTRKRLEKLIPKADRELREKIAEWEAQYSEFRIGGVRYLDAMDNEILEEQMRKEEERQAREREKNLRKAAAQGLTSTMPLRPSTATRHSVNIAHGDAKLSSTGTLKRTGTQDAAAAAAAASSRPIKQSVVGTENH